MGMKKAVLILAVLFQAFGVLAQPVITSQPTNQIVVNGSNASFKVAVTGTGPFTYQWQLNGTNLPNQNNIITHIAGHNSSGFSGDGGPATNALLYFPTGVTVDALGNIFIVDTDNNRIRKIDTNGIITTVAGNGSYGYSGDGGMATNAALYLYGGSPTYQSYNMAVDAAGNLFIADTANNRIRKVDTNGVITTIAGTNSAGSSGDGGPAANAKLSYPSGVAVDNCGNVFIADKLNNRVRKVSVNGLITTVAGTNTAGFSGDGGAATNARLTSPCSVAVDGSTNLFISDSGYRVRKVDVNGIITTVAGNGTTPFSGDGGAATNAGVNPIGITVDTYDDIFIADYLNSRIRMVGANGNITTVAGFGSDSPLGDGGAATNAAVWQPTGVGVDYYGNLFIAGYANCSIRKVDFGRFPSLTLDNVTTNKALLAYSLPTNSLYLTLNGLSATNDGNFSVVVTSPFGSVTSNIASLTVFMPPSITIQPANISVSNGGSACFNVAVSGDAPFDYQWYTSSGSSAAAVANVSLGHVLSATITSGGSGYATVPQVQFVGGSGSGASATAVVDNGVVTAIQMTRFGYAYYTPPVIQIDNPSPIVSTLLSGMTNASFTLPVVTGAYTTNYFVVVTNNYGSVTSVMAALEVFMPPQIFSAQNLATGLQMQCTGTPNYPYILQSATNLTPPVQWQPLMTNNSDTNGFWQCTDTNIKTGQKFYRVLGQ